MSEDVARFTNGEARLVYARYRDARPGAPLYYLEDNTVTREIRAYATENLMCVVPGCPSVGLTAAARTTKRDGFVHLGTNVTTGHAPESVNHLQGKAAVMAWLARTQPDLDVRTEVDLGGRERRADVLVTFPSGQVVAIEVQYSALTVAQWEERHQSYAAMGIVDVWLFGHTGAHLSIREGDVYPNEVHRAVMDTGAPLLWLNPNLNKIATAVVVAQALRAPELGTGYPVRFTDGHDTTGFTVATGFGPAQLMIDRLDAAWLTPEGIRTPRQDTLGRDRATLDDINAARILIVEDVRARRDIELAAAAARRAEAERAARIEADFQRAVKEADDARWYQQERDRAAAEAAGREARQARDQQRAQREASTHLTAAHDEVVAAFGAVPAFLSVPVGPHSPEQRTCWQWEPYRDVIHWAVGGTFTLWDAYKAAAKTIGLGSATGQAVRAWLAELVQMGMLATKDKGRG